MRYITPRRPAPADLLEVLLSTTWIAAARHYGCGNSTLANWVKRMSPEDRAAVTEAGRQRKAAYTEGKREAAARTKAATKAAKAKQGKPAALWVGAFNKSYAPQVPSRTVDMAVTHLRKAGFVPVFDAGKVYGKDKAGLFIVGKMQLDSAGVMALAAAKGFDQDAWKRIGG